MNGRKPALFETLAQVSDEGEMVRASHNVRCQTSGILFDCGTMSDL